MTENRYSMSFTSGALLRQESLTVAELYHDEDDWDATREQVIADNLLQMRTLNASKRIYREVSSRLRQLSPEQFDLLLQTGLPQQRHLLWLAYCRRYRFVYDFATDVVREKYLRLDYALTNDDYDIFFDKKAEWHPEVERVAPVTKARQRQMVYRTMREADLLSDDHQILPAILSPAVAEAIVHDDPADLQIFPLSDFDLMALTR